MKHLPGFFFLLILSSESFSQITKDNWLIGGSAKFYSYSSTYTSTSFNSEGKYSETDIGASIGYFFIDKLSLGVRPHFSWTKGHGIEATTGVVTNIKHFTFGPFCRFYYLNTDKPCNILTDIGYELGINDWHGHKGKLNTFSILTGPVIFFNSCVGIELLLGYSSSKETIQDIYADKRNGFRTSVGFQIHLQKQ